MPNQPPAQSGQTPTSDPVCECGHPASEHESGYGCMHHETSETYCTCLAYPEQIAPRLVAALSARVAELEAALTYTNELNTAVVSENTKLKDALEKIDRITTEWDANKLGAIQIQRKRWQRCGEIARGTLGGAK